MRILNYLFSACCPKERRVDPQPASFFSILPKEIQLVCFQYLEPSELMKCSYVCKKWKSLASDNRLWKVFIQRLGLEKTRGDLKEVYRVGLLMCQIDLKSKVDEIYYRQMLEMPLWAEKLNPNDNLKISSFIAKLPDKEEYFFKTYQGSNLVFILIPEKRELAAIIKFNNSFQKDSSEENKTIFEVYHLRARNKYGINERNSIRLNEFQYRTVLRNLGDILKRCLSK